MKVESRDMGTVRVLSFKGKLVIGEGDVAARDAVEVALYDKMKTILLDLKGVTAMDSSGLGELMALRKKAQAQSVNLGLLHVEDKVKQVLQMARLIGVFETFKDEKEAVAHFEAQ